MRLLRPYAAHERRIDLSLRESIDELAFELASLQRRVASINAVRSELSAMERDLSGLDADVRGAYAVQAEELKEALSRIEALEKSLSRDDRPAREPKRSRTGSAS
jgi:predicted  nucleic acid-binding Zn-ribbon protein